MFRSILVLSLTLFTTYSMAASFDCAAAQSVIEHRICASPTLQELDERLGAAYSALGEKSDAVRNAQRNWIKARNACADDACVERHYLQRIAALSGPSTNSQAPFSPKAPLGERPEGVAHEEVTRGSGLSTQMPRTMTPEPAPVFDSPKSGATATQPQSVASTSPALVVPVKQSTNNEERPLLERIWDGITEHLLYAFLATVALGAAIKRGFDRRCPNCRRWFAGQQQSSELLDRRTGNRTVTRQDRHTDPSGKLLKTVERKEQIQVEVSTWKDHYQCKHCNHLWASVSTTETR